MKMSESIRKAIAGNVERLMEYHGSTSPKGKMTQTELARKTGISQRTICNLLDEESAENIKSDTIERLAKGFGLMPYHLLIPDLPIEELTSKRIEKVVECYTTMPMAGRENVERIAENELRYSEAGNNTAHQKRRASD